MNKLAVSAIILSFLYYTAQSQCFPSFNKIVVVIGENTEANTILGSPDAPYMNNLAQSGALFTNSHGINHPSQPNYLHLFSGSNQGILTNNVPPAHFTTPNLARNLINAGKTFISYSEELPSIGSDVAFSGGYQRKHNPVANWMGTGTNQVSPTLNQRLLDFPSNFNNLPDVSFVIPNQCHAGHDICPPLSNVVKQFDAFLVSLDAYKQWCVNNNSLLIVTYDEGNPALSSNVIYTVFYGSNVLTGTYNQNINHYNILRVLEDLCGTAYAGASATADVIDYCWQVNTTINLKLFIQGYYSQTPPNQRSPLYSANLSLPVNVDTITVNLVNPQAPYALASTFKGILQSDGTIVCTYSDIPCGEYYIQILHKNSLETWSANPVSVSPNADYDFTLSASLAYGDNQASHGMGVYAIYSGDVNQDALIDMDDYSLLELSLFGLTSGFVSEDLNGDGVCEGSDLSLLENNISLGLSVARPQ